MSFPAVDLFNPTRLLFEWNWLLLTWANFVAYALVLLVFILGVTVRLPGARREISEVESQRSGTSTEENR